VKLLCSRHDIDLNSENNYGETPLLKASRNGHETVVKLLLTRNNIKQNANGDNQTLL
jgi:ankyrin repeat protein